MSGSASRATKRVVDVIGAATLIVLLSPVLLAAAIAVKLDSPGPVLFRQRRSGLRGAEFRLHKLRTMRVGAERQRHGLVGRNETDGHLFKIREDPRVTRAGRLMRRFSLDELPQLFNVVMGDMSLVGPRPLPLEDSDFGEQAGRRLLVRPGLTGLWQVSGRSTLSWEETLRLDLTYVETWSLRLDLVILARTPRAVLRGEGAY